MKKIKVIEEKGHGSHGGHGYSGGHEEQIVKIVKVNAGMQQTKLIREITYSVYQSDYLG